MSEREVVDIFRELIRQIEAGDIEVVNILWNAGTKEFPDTTGKYMVASLTGFEMLTISYKRREAE